jgi:hypothetical protein
VKARSPFDLNQWTHEEIRDECRSPYREYHRRRRDRHVAYYETRPEQRSQTHPFAASEASHAFPPGWEHLADAPGFGWHRHHLSGGSSQVLALSLLQPAVATEPSLSWLWPEGGPLPALGQPINQRFEVELDATTLNERPRTTAVDWLVSGTRGVMTVEAKFTERGFDRCSCPGEPNGDCSDAVLQRPYWSVAHQHFGLAGPAPPTPCPLSLAYQPVRNAAAALALAGRGLAVFLLLYDEENPYFAGAGEWPGWAAVLELMPVDEALSIHAASWQQLLPVLPIPDDVREWAFEKHGLAPG